MFSNATNGQVLFWVLLFMSITAFVTIMWAFIYWWRKDRHTREKFAFLGAMGLLGFASLIFVQLFFNGSLPAVLFGVLSFLANNFGVILPAYEAKALSAPEAAFSVVLIFGMGFWFFQVHNNWDGRKSKAQYEQEQNQISPNILKDVLLLLSHDKERRSRLKPVDVPVESSESALNGAQDTRAWHEQAKHLWTLHRRFYSFNETYDSAHKCWWGKETNVGALACLACYPEMPPDSEIDALAKYMMQMQDRDGSARMEIILACKNGIDTPPVEIRDGYILKRTTLAALLDKLVDFSDYFEDIKFRVERATLPDSPLTLAQTYTPSRYGFSSFSASDSSAKSDDLESFIGTWLEEKTTRQLALLGEYGQGKSTISLMLSCKMISLARNNAESRIPILLELRGKSPRSLSPEELLATWAYRYGIEVKALVQLVIAGRLLLIFEGFDEMDLTGDTDARLNHFRTLWRLCYPNAKILITGRPNFFLDNNELKRALGIDKPHATRPYCEAIYLAPFSLEQIEDSLRSTEQLTRNEIYQLAIADLSFYEIVSRPSLLFVVSTLWQRERLSEKQGQISSAFVMDLFIRHSYRRQGAKQTERNFQALNSAERGYFMSGIAAYMALNSLPNQISQHQLDEATQLFVKAIPDDVSLSVGAAADEIRHPLKRNHAERYDWEGHTAEALAHIKTDVRVCGILVTDSSKDGTFKFAHKSFLEFLQAQLASDLCKSEPLLQARALSIMRALGLRIDGLVSSLEVALFFGELLRERFRTTDTKADDHALSALLFNSLVISNVNPPKWITFLIGFQFHFQSIVLLLMVRMGLGPKRLLSTLMMRQRAVIVMAFGVTISAVPLILSLLGISHSLTLAIAGMASFTLASFALGGIFFMGSSRIAVNRTQIWLQVCRKLKIPSKTIARQVGPYFVQVFDHDGSTKLDPFTEIGSVRAKD